MSLSARKKRLRRGREIRQLIKQIGEERGQTNEKKVLAACTDSSISKPSWFLGISRASPELDRCGVDFLIETTEAGLVPLQVKSSFTGLKSHRAHPNYDEGNAAVVVFPEDTAAAIAQKVVRSVGHARTIRIQRLRAAQNTRPASS
jgi:hypothetical protein